MVSGKKPTRRSFVQALASISAVGGFASLAPAAFALNNSQFLPTLRYGFVGSADNVINVFVVERNGLWKRTQTMSSASPASIVLSPDQRFLYVANSIESFDHLPSGSVEAYAVDEGNGRLSLINRQTLALFATAPTHIAVSPNGLRLAVVTAGGAYNLLPLDGEGTIGRVTASARQLSYGLKGTSQLCTPARTVRFDSDDVLWATDHHRGSTTSYLVTEHGALSISQRGSIHSEGPPAHRITPTTSEQLFVASLMEPEFTHEPLAVAFMYH